MLERIVPFVLRAIQQNIPNGETFFVGSLANGEQTFVRDSLGQKEILLSDLDIIVLVDVPTFVRNLILGLPGKLSKALTYALESEGHKTHVSMGVFSYRLYRLIHSYFPNTIYQYEMVKVTLSKNHYGISPIRYNKVRPSKSDCIDLIFSAIVDYLSMKLELSEDATTEQKCYAVAKRCLTLIYSLLLFEAKEPTGYRSTVKLIREYFSEFQNILGRADLEVLTVLAEYKIQGDTGILVEKLPLKEKTIDEALWFLYGFFERLAERVLHFELKQSLACTEDSERGNESLCGLLEGYTRKSKVSVAGCLALSLKYTVYLAVDRDLRRLKFRTYSALSRRLEMNSYIRYLVGKSFLLTTSADRDYDKLKSVASYTMDLWNLFMM